MATLQEQLQYAVDTKNLIRQEIIAKGVEVPQNTVFRDYPEKIKGIISDFIPTWTRDSGGAITNLVYLKDTLTMPTEIDGQPLSNNFTYRGRFESLWHVRKIVFPEYFIGVTLGGLFSNSQANEHSWLEEIEVNAETLDSTSRWGFVYYLRRMKGLTLNKYQNLGRGFKPSFLTSYPISNTFFIRAPELVNLSDFHFGTENHTIELTLDTPKLKLLGGDGNSGDSDETARYCTGTWVLPQVTTWQLWGTPHGEQTLKLPALENQIKNGSFSYGDTGILHLYMGPNVSKIESAANFKAHPNNIDIHIPAGESTTKATLDAAGITYTQDYVIQGV